MKHTETLSVGRINRIHNVRITFYASVTISCQRQSLNVPMFCKSLQLLAVCACDLITELTKGSLPPHFSGPQSLLTSQRASHTGNRLRGNNVFSFGAHCKPFFQPFLGWVCLTNRLHIFLIICHFQSLDNLYPAEKIYFQRTRGNVWKLFKYNNWTGNHQMPRQAEFY